ncbi:hypothetical protein [Mycobacterium sp. JS623]|uniref:hypothetical protein n=1 Tax=Mycobacterium sp. JS623 TaxID=212767 RepID=UPI0002FCC8B3|nr:hypothetical protein [Mycobacterium sp. JS623]
MPFSFSSVTLTAACAQPTPSLGIDLDCGVKVWGHGGDIEGFHSLMAKAFAGPAVSITFTESAKETEPSANDPRAAVLNAVYCP